MLDTQFTTFFLDLEDLSIVNSTQDSLTIQLPRKLHTCPCCGQQTQKVHDYRLQKIKHLPLLHKPYDLFLRKRRYACTHCSKRFLEDNPFLSKYQRMTSLLKEFIISQFAQMKSASAIARDTNVSTTTALRLFDHVSYPVPQLPEVLSIDEFKGNADGEKFQCLLVNPKTKTALDVLENRKTDDLCKYFASFPMEQRAHVKYVVMDLSSLFRSVIKSSFPNAKIVADKFHTCRLANWALESVRKEVQKEFSDHRRKYFKKSRFLLLKRHKNLKSDADKEQLAIMLDVSEKLKHAYRLKELFYGVMDSTDSVEYVKRFKHWQEEVMKYDIKQFNKLMKTVIEWKNEIIAAISTGYSNGYVEGCNNRTKVLKRTCYGIQKFKRMRNRILYMAS
ncbi:MAG: transposase family protein [Firmicutes bacterium]|nr:transposase family protein [Bacillota bacterium]